LAYICPHLEYAAPVWDPYQQGLDSSTPWRERRSLHRRHAPKTGALDMSLCFSHATCPPLPTEDTIIIIIIITIIIIIFGVIITVVVVVVVYYYLLLLLCYYYYALQ